MTATETDLALARIRQQLHDLRNTMLTVALRFSATKRAHRQALAEYGAARTALRATVRASQAQRGQNG